MTLFCYPPADIITSPCIFLLLLLLSNRNASPSVTRLEAKKITIGSWLVVICFCSAFHTRTISIHLYFGYASSSSFPLASQSLFFYGYVFGNVPTVSNTTHNDVVPSYRYGRCRAKLRAIIAYWPVVPKQQVARFVF